MKRALLLLCVATSGYAASPPAPALAFKSWQLGSPSAVVEADARFKCFKPAPPATSGDLICALPTPGLETIAGAPILIMAVSIYGGIIQGIVIDVEERHFSAVAGALTEKYGAGKRDEGRVSNRMGAKFDDLTILWQIGSSMILAEQRAEKIDHSRIQFLSGFAVEESKRRRDEAAKQKASDL